MADGLLRYGIRHNGPTEPLAVPMDDGYWTPWHQATAALDVAQQEIARLRAQIHVVEGERDQFLDAMMKSSARWEQAERERDDLKSAWDASAEQAKTYIRMHGKERVARKQAEAERDAYAAAIDPHVAELQQYDEARQEAEALVRHEREATRTAYGAFQNAVVRADRAEADNARLTARLSRYQILNGEVVGPKERSIIEQQQDENRRLRAALEERAFSRLIRTGGADWLCDLCDESARTKNDIKHKSSCPLTPTPPTAMDPRYEAALDAAHATPPTADPARPHVYERRWRESLGHDHPGEVVCIHCGQPFTDDPTDKGC